MKRSDNYETDDGVVTVRPVLIKDSENLAYITIYAANNKVHIGGRYLPEIRDILKQIEEVHPYVE